MDRYDVECSWWVRMLVEQGFTESLLARRELEQARWQAERYLEVTLATADRMHQALAWEANARLAMAESNLVRADDCIGKAVIAIAGFEVPLAAWRVHATAAECSARAGDRRAAAPPQLSRTTILDLLRILPSKKSLSRGSSFRLCAVACRPERYDQFITPLLSASGHHNAPARRRIGIRLAARPQRGSSGPTVKRMIYLHSQLVASSYLIQRQFMRSLLIGALHRRIWPSSMKPRRENELSARTGTDRSDVCAVREPTRKGSAAMLRITDIRETMPDGSARWTLELNGNIDGEWVTEMRRAWRAVQLAAAGASIRVLLADVQSVDIAAKVLLAEMYRDGVQILASDPFTAAIRDEVAEGVLAPGPLQSRSNRCGDPNCPR
jgi:ABC-type transporter Mla MlaB component